MLIQAKITEAINNAKYYSSLLIAKIVASEALGEDMVQQRQNFIVLGQWIGILQFYLDNNFDTNGNIEPIETCLSEDEITALMSKIKIMTNNTVAPNQFSDWILALGSWSDTGYFRDGAKWKDSAFS